MAKLVNLARMITPTTGTGTLTLGAAAPGFLTFAQAGVNNNDLVSYGISDGPNSEVGTGLYTAAGLTLTRNVIKSTNSGSPINLGGSAHVFVTALAEDLYARYVRVSDTPPTNVDDGSLWWNSTSGILYLRYNDGDSSQWVLATPQADTSALAPLASPTFTGDPKAPTPTAGDNDTSIATTAFVTAAVAAGGVTAATQADQEAAASTTVVVTPGRQQFHPSAAKCWAYCVVTSGVPALSASYNMTSITDNSVGDIIFTIATDFSSTLWSPNVEANVVGITADDSFYKNQTAGAVSGACLNTGVASVDPNSWSFQGFGDQ